MAADARQRRRAWLGGLIIAGLLGLTVVVFFLDRVILMLTRHYEFVAIVPNAPGLRNGSAVWLGGREVGTIQRVALLPVVGDSATGVALTLRLPLALQPHVRADSRVRLTSARLIGERVVDIIPGTARAPVLAEGDTLHLRWQVTPEELTARAAVVNASLDSALAGLRALAPQAERSMARAQRALAALQPALQEAHALNASLATGAGIAQLRDPALAAALERARSAAAELPRALEPMRLRAGEMRDMGAALARLQLRADSIRVQLTAAADLLGQGNGSLSRFQQDSALIRAIHAARADLDSLMAEVRRNPLRFVF
ncbi:MAG TPA: MlaD family protein [Longimicrobiales bacterium]|nr:MlaD family protein [Longimicrobiales bacterium]